MAKPFTNITSLTKSELAWQYSPDLSQTAALNRLRRWIEGDTALLTALKETGYRPQQRILTARQVAIIHEYIGMP